ncbi:sensor domain-containing protein [Tsukamurella soli]|uniref:PknH-like extracellular domain-containing protein n=1 Tax=Tsukamurella soli TaxID=644556 RepID=A0ABP8J3U9_9ACTN
MGMPGVGGPQGYGSGGYGPGVPGSGGPGTGGPGSGGRRGWLALLIGSGVVLVVAVVAIVAVLVSGSGGSGPGPSPSASASADASASASPSAAPPLLPAAAMITPDQVKTITQITFPAPDTSAAVTEDPGPTDVVGSDDCLTTYAPTRAAVWGTTLSRTMAYYRDGTATDFSNLISVGVGSFGADADAQSTFDKVKAAVMACSSYQEKTSDTFTAQWSVDAGKTATATDLTWRVTQNNGATGWHCVADYRVFRNVNIIAKQCSSGSVIPARLVDQMITNAGG